MRTKPIPTSYEQCVRYWEARRSYNNRHEKHECRDLKHNTELHRWMDGTFSLQFNGKALVWYFENGRLSLYDNEQRTKVILRRLNQAVAGKGSLRAEGGQWRYAPRDSNDEYVFRPGMQIDPAGRVVGIERSCTID